MSEGAVELTNRPITAIAVRFGERTRSLGKPACTGRIQFNAGQICQRLLQLTVIRASGFIGDPLDLPLGELAYQLFEPLGRICELSLKARGMGKHIKGCFGDVDADRLW